jgi:alkylation response protein AidB-like acyl-CoA dehydrogenase
MDFALSEESRAVFDMAKAFGAERIAPHAREWEAQGTIPRDLWPELAALGFGGLCVPEESGGAGLSRLDATLVFEALAMACPSVAAFLSIHNMCAKMIDSFGSPELKARFLPGALSMETVFSYCLTEPGSGSDAAALRTRAERTNEGWRLTGTKAFISGGGYSDAYIVMARSGGEGPKGISAFIVEDGAEGLSFGGLEDKMGWRSQETRQVQMDGCLTPAGNLLGEEGQGFRYAMAGLDGGRLNIAACSLGAAQAAGGSTSSRRSSSASRTWRSSFRRRASSCARRPGSSTGASRTRPSTARWPRSSSPRPAAASPTSACSFTAATATWPTTASRRSSGTCACTRSSREPTRSCG